MFLRYLAQGLALAAVCLPQASGPVFVAGFLVMVSAFMVHIFFEWVRPDEVDSGDSSSQSGKLQAATATRYPDLAFAFVFTSGALIACAATSYSLAAFLTMFIAWQIVRGKDHIHGPADFLPDPAALLHGTAQNLTAIVKRQRRITLPSTFKKWLPWLVPLATLIIPIARKVA